MAHSKTPVTESLHNHGASRYPPEPLNLSASQQAAYDASVRLCLQPQHGDEAPALSEGAPSLVHVGPLEEFCAEYSRGESESSRPTLPLVSVLHVAEGLPELARRLERLEAKSEAPAEEEERRWQQAGLMNELVGIIVTEEAEETTGSQRASGEPDEINVIEEVSPDPMALETTQTQTQTQTSRNQLETFLNRIATSAAVPRRQVCQHPFKRNDIVWVCRTCQADETCVLCHECFTQSHHEGHDVAFYHAQAGGCCDCGDADGA